MNATLQPLLIWLRSRTPRERLLLSVLSAVLLVWLAFVAIWQPLQAARVRLADQVLRHERALAVLQSLPVTAAALAAVATDDRPLNMVITETAATFQLTIRRLEPEGNRVRVVMDEAPFEAVILWMEAVQRDKGLRITDLDMTRRPSPGVVNATMALER